MSRPTYHHLLLHHLPQCVPQLYLLCFRHYHLLPLPLRLCQRGLQYLHQLVGLQAVFHLRHHRFILRAVRQYTPQVRRQYFDQHRHHLTLRSSQLHFHHHRLRPFLLGIQALSLQYFHHPIQPTSLHPYRLHYQDYPRGLSCVI